MSQLYWERLNYSEVMEIIEDALEELVIVESKFQIADKVFEKLFNAGYLR